MLRCILVDDEPLARERLRALLAEATTEVEVVGEAEAGRAALALIQELHPDVVFLDVSMPGLDGFDVAELIIPPRPFIVFVTAHGEHALRAFDVQALDYLTKPVRAARLNRTLEHIAQIARPAETARSAMTRIAVHQQRRLRVVPIESVRWFETRDRLVYAQLADGAFPIDHTLDELESRLDRAMFLRIHRSYIVNAADVRELSPWFAGGAMVRLADGSQLPVARRRIREVKNLLGVR
jgi:two-component system, LytTR family, response regulator